MSAIVKCARCERPLRDPKSIARGYGRTCAAKAAAAVEVANVAGFKPAQVAKAVELVRAARIRNVGHLCLAESSKGDTRYQCSPTGECTCVAASHGTRCYHALAASILAAA